MADPIQGKLVWQGSGDKRVRRVIYPTKKGMSIPTPFDTDQLAGSLRNRTEDEIEVDLEMVGGKPIRIRPVGESFVAAEKQPPRRPVPHRGQQGRVPQGQRQPQQRPSAIRGAFHNPYNFVPALPRDGVTGELGDHKPIGHHVLHPNHCTGVIRVKMTVKSPLLVPDTANAKDVGNDHKSFPIRVDAEGKPYIPSTSIKGMLRSAYEAVTNSRLAVFAGHDRKLAFRMATQEGLSLIPARVENSRLILLPGTSTIGTNGPQGPMYAAWLPRYFRGRLDRNAVRYSNNQLPTHRDEVECWVELIQHWRWDRRNNRHQQDFQYWRVRQIVPRGQQLGPQPNASQDPGKRDRSSYHQPLIQFRRVIGFVCITNANIDRKHDERVFFTATQQSAAITLTEQEGCDWETLILNYQQEHAEEIRQGRTSPPALSNSEWSRQIVGINGQQSAETHLSDGTLLYAQVEQVAGGWKLCGLYPVNISRKLHDLSPIEILHQSLHPATSHSQFSPADRVFGWVKQRGKGAYKGNVRIGPVTCETNDAIEDFGTPGLPLAILGQPKPQQARFYVAVNQNGEAQPNGLRNEEAGYREESYPGTKKGLRGRKVYPHHNGQPNGHWDNGTQDRTQQAVNGHFQECRRPHEGETHQVQEGKRTVTRPTIESDGSFRLLPGDEHEQRDSQNRSIQGWVKPGTEFTFDIHVTNLSKVELGGLLWLLSLKDNHFHRFGGGKPLGLGSVRLEIDPGATQLHNGENWKEIYSTLDDVTLDSENYERLIEDFKEAVRTSYGSPVSFDDVPFIAAWLRMAQGFADNLPVHYPRVTRHIDPEGKNFEWFTGNERGQKVCLSNLANDPGLPMPNSGQGEN